jgi:nitroreductase
MEGTTLSLQEAIRVRHSTRRYADQTVSEEIRRQLFDRAAEAEHLHTPGVRLELVNGREQVASILSRYAGIYGLVQGAPHLILGILSEDSDGARLDLGYVLEQVVLEATRLGADTCWMTGSYEPDEAAQAVEVASGESVAAAIALGYAREDRLARLHDTVVRRMAGAHQRKPLEELVFDGRWGEPWHTQEADEAMVKMLEAARLAPSAINRQPWRFVLRPGEIHGTVRAVDTGPIDAGITMSHITLVAKDVGREGEWRVRLDDARLAQELGLPEDVRAVGTFAMAL